MMSDRARLTETDGLNGLLTEAIVITRHFNALGHLLRANTENLIGSRISQPGN